MFSPGLAVTLPRPSLRMPEEKFLEYSLNDYLNDNLILGGGFIYAYPYPVGGAGNPNIGIGSTVQITLPQSFYLYSKDGFLANTSQGNFGAIVEISVQGTNTGTAPGLTVAPFFFPLIVFPGITGQGTEENVMINTALSSDPTHSFGASPQTLALTAALGQQRTIFDVGDITGILTAPFGVGLQFTNTSANIATVNINNFVFRMKY